MSACIIWLDSEHAKIFKISAAGVEKKSLKQTGSAHPVSSAHFDAHKNEAIEHFFHQIAGEVGSVEELLIFGSGVAKSHFKSHLEKHHHKQLAQHIVGVETLENLTDNQILEAGRKFFKKYDAYQSTV